MYIKKASQYFCPIHQHFVTITCETEVECGYGCAITVTSEIETCSSQNQCGHFKSAKCFLLNSQTADLKE